MSCRTYLSSLRMLLARPSGNIRSALPQPSATTAVATVFTRGVATQTNTSIAHPRRAVFFVPASDEKKIRKATGLPADCLVFDLEDAVAQDRKAEARSTLVPLLEQLEFLPSSEICVRVNSFQSGHTADDVDCLKSIPPGKIQSVFLPKAESATEVKELRSLLQHTAHKELPLILAVESASALLQLSDIITADSRVQAVVFGGEDFAANVGLRRTSSNEELLYARSKVVLHAAAACIQAIDIVCTEFTQLERVERESVQGRSLGFSGKQVIHPKQLPIVQRCFAPSEEEVKRAAAIVEANRQHQLGGKGAFNFEGTMIDMPLVLAAERCLTLAEAIKRQQS